ncbi:hypothetical protein BT96DRAFT_939489 [Gymnopus androsaceus JB14]|uniref:Uncharacterized protein n=1 Tax=Gymnopus androsaceus JB14 TaxID=1447944 RepID=A0A6A4HNU9_9AGAR|nr:hypothetical protein BT96DRAFT_939489 [Gymnopus androsaceus JB14]
MSIAKLFLSCSAAVYWVSGGGYISVSGATAVFTDVTVTSMGTTAVITGTYIQPAVVNYYNFTIVESSGGYWESAVKSVSATNTVASYGEYESCSFNGDGGSSVLCTDIFRTVTRSGVETFTETFKGSTVPLTVMTVTAVPSSTGSGSVVTPTSSSNAATPTSSSNAVTPTSSSNAAMSSQQGSCWKMGLYVSMLSGLMTPQPRVHVHVKLPPSSNPPEPIHMETSSKLNTGQRSSTKQPFCLVGAVPTPTSTVTVYGTVASQFASISETPISGGIGTIDVSTLGVSTGSDGTETTYSIGEYLSVPDTPFTTQTITEGPTGQTETTTAFFPADVFTENCEMNSLDNAYSNNPFLVTLVESSGGFWASFSSFASGTGQAFYETCTFDANGGMSASCMEINYFATSSGSLRTTATSFEASKTPLVVLPVPTSSSNTAISTSQGPYWKMGLYVSMLCMVVLVV